MQGKLHCMRQSAKCSKRSTKCEVSRLEKMKLDEIFREKFSDLKLRDKLLLAFHMVSTVIKYKMLCHMQAMW